MLIQTMEYGMATDSLKREAELRADVIDRLIAASLRDGIPAREDALRRWRSLSTSSLVDSSIRQT
jgi:hypothetical protein